MCRSPSPNRKCSWDLGQRPDQGKFGRRGSGLLTRFWLNLYLYEYIYIYNYICFCTNIFVYLSFLSWSSEFRRLTNFKNTQLEPRYTLIEIKRESTLQAWPVHSRQRTRRKGAKRIEESSAMAQENSRELTETPSICCRQQLGCKMAGMGKTMQNVAAHTCHQKQDLAWSSTHWIDIVILYTIECMHIWAGGGGRGAGGPKAVGL